MSRSRSRSSRSRSRIGGSRSQVVAARCGRIGGRRKSNAGRIYLLLLYSIQYTLYTIHSQLPNNEMLKNNLQYSLLDKVYFLVNF